MKRVREITILDDTLTTFLIRPPSDQLLLGHARTMVVLVHGYNTDRSEAAEDYVELRRSLRDAKVSDAVAENIWELYWPGYLPKGRGHFWRRTLGGLPSKATYSLQVHRAVWIGKKLARYFSSIPSKPQLIFVGHSLGCRVVLEVIRHLDHLESDQVVAFCLMAAAVPVEMLDDEAIRDAVEKIDKRYILYSNLDQVLKYWFSPGQWASAPVGWPTAIGRSGEPEEVWSSGFESRVNTWLDHGDYFRGRKEFSFGKSQTAPYVARLLGKPTPWESKRNDSHYVEWTLPTNDPHRDRRPLAGTKTGRTVL